MARIQRLRKRGYGEKLGPGWRFVRTVLYRPFVTLFRLEYRHIERIPQQGPVIVVLNHVSHVDPFLAAAFLLDAARTPLFLAKESIFEVPVIGPAMRWMGHIPVRRGTTDARQSLAAAVAALERGGAIVLHPEGTVTRDPDGWPMNGKTGAARLVALVPDVPVVPVTQWGVQEQFDLYRKKIKLIPRPRHVISVGEPIDLSAFRDRDPRPQMLREMTDVIMRRLRADLAELRGVPAPEGDLYRWTRRGESPGDAA
ncbi:lysophospholipid acyltransferase family protein [uncultured Jatrophihabitans sp.]|uniref:lysophospholipid acyltransferase family protein n=1 Tax=uncultured Jatrophihabitans sp. TaxID=1610747 RepID=UPI0035CBFEBF